MSRDDVVTRRKVLGLLGASGLGAYSSLMAFSEARASQAHAGENEPIYLGCFSGRGSKSPGLVVGLRNKHDGSIIRAGHVPEAKNASFMAFSPDRSVLYCTSETSPEGEVVAYQLKDDPLRPQLLNRQSTRGRAPTHISVHPNGRFLLVANYGDGSVGVHPLLPDGGIAPSSDHVRHSGTKPLAHQIVASPDGNWVLAVDLGADSVFVYGFDNALGRLKLNQRFALPHGFGPRHLVFHPNGRHVYILGEKSTRVMAASWRSGAGELVSGPEFATLEDGYSGKSAAAEIAISTDGRFVYASNRGPDTISMFGVRDEGQRLVLQDRFATGGRWPRHFALHPSGHWIYVANQHSNAVHWLPRDVETGRLGPAAGSFDATGVAMVAFGSGGAGR